jgi:hypothetical protein
VTLTAGKMTLQEYITKFNRMAQLLPDMVKPESKKIERFISGFPSDIKEHVISARPNTFRSVVDLSRILYLERGGEIVAEPKKKKWSDNKRGSNKNEKKRPRERKNMLLRFLRR